MHTDVKLIFSYYRDDKVHTVHLLLSTRAHRQGVDISFTVCVFVCLFVWSRISPPKINIAASNFARWFVGVLVRESPILGNFAPPELPEAQNRRIGQLPGGKVYGMKALTSR